MADRAYTVAEIDALRGACKCRWLYGTTRLSSQGGMSRSYGPGELDAAVEQMVRTYMMAGIVAEDIYAQDAPMTAPQERV